MNPFQDVFISYGRADSKYFAKELHDHLVEQGLTVWFDSEDVPVEVNYQKQIDDGIDNADNFLFIISPDSVNSQYCALEIEQALKQGKRIIPLLHVEKINRATWQQQNSSGTDAEWEAFQSQGLHDHLQNMHPEIRKINWVYMRDEVDNFEQGLQSLLKIINRQKDYVRQHTLLLSKAADWEQHQRQSHYLLATETVQQARIWLQTSFHNEQPPCVPTDLQCELITESLKAANGFMTQVFVVYAEEDTLVINHLRQSLQREGLTVWDKATDIQTGSDLSMEIRSGIEKASNVIYLLSPHSLDSSSCQEEVQYALQFKKRVVPLLLEPIDQEALPKNQKSLQCIDYTQGQTTLDQHVALAKLLRALKENAGYYEEHKQLLVRALQWDRQKRPKSSLLQGQEFTLAEQWLNFSQTETDSPATDLQQIYIQSSREMNQFFDAFISYGRADSKAFATQLHDQLADHGFNIWFDQNDIPLGVDFQEQIDAGIEKAHNFIFIIAPHSVNSPYCRKEIELALKLNKRIIPILHVEEINRETWQQRNPSRSQDTDWEAAQERGEHNSFKNMVPEISKINWVYCRAEDNFDQSLDGLVGLLHQHEDYVKQHTEFLTKALAWERNQKQSRYLLVGEERTQAEAWLKNRFMDEQPPCIPSDLHCELITESIKNANNLMTKVFLSYAEEDRETEVKVRRSLMREGFTVWSSQQDIETGVDFQEAINRGIETADNVVYLISEDSLQSSYCQQEIEYALSLNKRIIPLRLTEVTPEQIPPELRLIQYIDLADNVLEVDYRKDESDLIKILRQDSSYYEQHKMILAQAFKWERQERNPSILLRGHNLRQAEAWLKLAQARAQQPATTLHQEFIQASLEQPTDVALDVFVSYSRADSDFVRKLNDALQAQGKTTWFDQESIASGTDFQQEIYRGIEASDNFLFVISPSSVNSPYCAGEVEHAAKLKKRFVTVVDQLVSSASLHPELAKVQWIDFKKHDGDFYANFSELIRTLDTDREHVRSHTRWSQRALEWLEKQRSNDLLLRGNEFALAETWLTEAEQGKKQPSATELQQEYFQASRQSIEVGIKREKQISLLIRSLLGVVSIAFVLAFFQWKRAETVQEGQINALSRYSQSLNASDQKLDALVEGIRAGQQLHKQLSGVQPETKQNVIQSLQGALSSISEQNQLAGHQGDLWSAQFSPDGTMIVTASSDKTVKLWNLEGEELQTLQVHNAEVYAVSFSPDSTMIATASEDGTAKLLDLNGEELQTFSNHDGAVYSVSFSPNGKSIATAGDDGTVKLWTLDGQEQQTINAHDERVSHISFSPDGKTIATASRDGTAKLWSITGQNLKVLQGHNEWVRYVSFSPNGQAVATAGDDNTVRFWSLQGQEMQILESHDDRVYSVNFSPDGQTVITASGDNTIKLWTLEGEEFQTLAGHENIVLTANFSPSGSKVVTASADETARIWQVTPPNFKVLQGHSDKVNTISYSPDGEIVATGGSDNLVKLWNTDGGELQTLTGHTDRISHIQFSSDGKMLATASADKTVRLWSIDGQELAVLDHEYWAKSVSFSPDNQLIATAGFENPITIWRTSGEKLQTLATGSNKVLSVSFSPDGQTLLSAGVDKVIRLLDLQGQEIRTLEGHSEVILGVNFSPDGQAIVSAADDSTARLWNLNGEELTVLEHENTVMGASFSPDGKMIATGGFGQVTRIWNLEGQILAIFEGHKDVVSSVQFSPDGQTLTTASWDSSVRLWALNLEQLQTSTMLLNSDLNGLLFASCKWVENYLKYSVAVEEEDRQICRGI
ncbi:MAG: TIR domain-containing protein [Cyanobacteria bacterium P01_D01_bin.156]